MRNSIPSYLSPVLGILLAAQLAAQGSLGPSLRRTAPSATQTLAIHQALPGMEGAITFQHAATGALLQTPVALQQVRLLSIDYVGRTSLSTWDTRGLHWRDDVPEGRIVLAANQGVLYRYSRRTPSGALRFGFLRLGGPGGYRLLLDRKGWGPSLDQDPFLGFVAFDEDTSHMLVATVLGAGGDLNLVDVRNGKVDQPTANQPPVDFGSAGLGLSEQWGFGVGIDGILRFNRNQAQLSQRVAIQGGSAAWFPGEAAFSPSRNMAITTGGFGPGALLPLVFGPQGSARPASSTPADLAGAGYLPGFRDGPTLAVDDLGTCAAWVVRMPTSREMFLGELQAAGSMAPVQVSQDLFFADTFSEIGAILFQIPGVATFAVGEPDGPLGVEGLDIYSASLAPGGAPVLENLTNTSGDQTVPFFGTPSITPQARIAIDGVGTLIYDDDEGRLLSVPEQGPGLNVLLANLKDHDFFMPVEGGILAGLRSDNGSNPHQVWFVPENLTSQPVLVDSSSPGMARVGVVRLEGNRMGFLLEQNDEPRFAGVLDFQSGVSSLAPTSAGLFHPALSPTPGGGFAFALSSGPGVQIPFSWGAPGALIPQVNSSPYSTLLPSK